MKVFSLRRLPVSTAVSTSRRLQHHPGNMMPFLKELMKNHQSQQERLQQRLDDANAQLTAAAVAAAVKLNTLELTSLREISDLNTKIKIMNNNLCLRSSMEVVAEVLRVHAKQLPKPIPFPPIGVQPVLDAIVAGKFNTPLILFDDAKKMIMSQLGGITSASVGCALKTIYAELLKHHHDGGSTQLTVKAGEQTPPEAIAALSVLLFARRLFHCSIDAAYQDSTGQPLFLLSNL
ncbi:hypothetical protein GGX14DRAFT_570041 [Mycena pura]|uniref:Uncharacterized protein n=1 Tax=Mycena pura TaxID=153505 RepID=A0AAD6V9N7_9AGAR|nr:hypothetical protein GGX14DRAFT_570041 [Mycena pura]